MRIGLAGSATAVAGLVTEPYAGVTDRAVVQFVVGNGATLREDLAAGALDAVLVHHLPAGHGFWFSPVAVDGLVVVVHPDSPVTDLSRGEVQALFNGRLADWSALGGPDAPVTLVSRGSGSGSRAIFEQRVMAEQRISINAQLAADDAALRAAVRAEPGALGFSMMGNVAAVKMVTIDGVAATPGETAVQRYPLTVPLYFAAPAEPAGELRAFLAWLQSEAGQAALGARYGQVR